MKIKRLRIQNFRSFEDEEILIGNYTALVGANGAGKSTVLCALNVFFRSNENAATNVSVLTAEDFHLMDTSTPVIITVTFAGLSQEAQEDFADYFRQGELTISAVAVFDEETRSAVVEQHGSRLAMSDFAEYFSAESSGASAANLKAIYEAIRQKYPDLPDAKTKDPMRAGLRAYEEAHPEACKLLQSKDQFYGFSRGANKLSKYVQWVYVPAVKDAKTEEQEARDTAFGRLLERRVRGAVNFEGPLSALKSLALAEYRALLDAQQDALNGLSASLQARLAEWAHPEARISLSWDHDAKKAVQVADPYARMLAGEGDFKGELARFGHGLQRSYLMALLQEEAAADGEGAPTLLLGIEEPELYQHPPQARHLASVLQSLSRGNAQVIASTHSPQFVTGRDFEAIRAVRRMPDAKKSVVRHATAERLAEELAKANVDALPRLRETLAKLGQVLQPGLSEMFFTSRLVLVEGIEDVAYITTWMALTDRWDEFRRRGCHVVPANAKSGLIQPVAVAKVLDIPTYVVWDADGDETHAGNRAKHQKDNAALLALVGGDPSVPFPERCLITPRYAVWKTKLADRLKDDLGADRWNQLGDLASAPFGNPPRFHKNAMQIAERLAIAKEAGDAFPALDELCSRILAL